MSLSLEVRVAREVLSLEPLSPSEKTGRRRSGRREGLTAREERRSRTDWYNSTCFEISRMESLRR